MSNHLTRLSFQFATALLVVAANSLMAFADDSRPQVHVVDERLEISVFAEAPDIVTPTGIAVDRDGNVLVIESHTHFPPADYAGPKEDRIKRFRDNDGDGKADEVTEFYVGGVATMSIAVHPNGYIYVATRSEIFRLRDTNRNGRADVREQLVQLETEGSYPHNGLSGFAIDFNGDLYFGMGENLGVDYTLIGNDKTRLRGGGEGGNIFRMSAAGNDLERVATGFWNPFHLCFDAFGRLFAVDNDPDSRPPCRLLHIVPGGDYGYRFRNGRKGTHPFTAWFGENPGTLGLVAETGEAPSGVLAYESDGLPDDYRGDLISGSWGNHTIERYRLKPRGASFQAVAETIVKGDRFFRPVGVAVAPDGSLLVSDWVDRSYNVHGKGRVWRIRRKGQTTSIHDRRALELESPDSATRAAAARMLVRRNVEAVVTTAKAAKDDKLRATALAFATVVYPEYAEVMRTDDSVAIRALGVRLADSVGGDAPGELPPLELAARLRRADADQHAASVLNAVDSDDPFLRQAARYAMQKSSPTERLVRYLVHPKAAVRRAAGLVLRQRLRRDEAERAATMLLRDADPFVRFVGIQWAGEAKLKSLEPLLESGLEEAANRGRWIDAYLAALHLLRDGKAADFEKQQQVLLVELLGRADLDPLLHAHVLRRIPPTHNWWNDKRVRERLAHQSTDVRLETIRTLYDSAAPSRGEWLLAKASADTEMGVIRRAAIAGLAPHTDGQRTALLKWASSNGDPLQTAALESLQGTPLSPADTKRIQLTAKNSALPKELFDRIVVADWKAARQVNVNDGEKLTAWLNEKNGDAKRGERIFFHPRGPKCYRCHRVNGRGGAIGPDLSSIESMKPTRLLHSILAPSDEIAPQYTPWRIELRNGKLYTGLLLTEKGDDQVFANEKGETQVIKRDEVELRTPLTNSIMPVGLADQMTDQELRDLVAYLAAPKH